MFWYLIFRHRPRRAQFWFCSEVLKPCKESQTGPTTDFQMWCDAKCVKDFVEAVQQQVFARQTKTGLFQNHSKTGDQLSTTTLGNVVSCASPVVVFLRLTNFGCKRFCCNCTLSRLNAKLTPPWVFLHKRFWKTYKKFWFQAGKQQIT